MFLYDSLPWYSWVAWLVVLGALIGLNEITRRWKFAGIAFFVALPIVLTLFVWPNTASAGSATGSWFHWVKVYSALAGCLGFMWMRYSKNAMSKKWIFLFPPFILGLNILEACIREVQIGSTGLAEGTPVFSGLWNWMNAVAGIISIVTICGWSGIFISKGKSRDMIWPDMLWFWIIAYDLWNFAYVYNCLGGYSFYSGLALLLACTIPEFFIKKGAWLQHRAHTLALWTMFTMAVPAFVSTSKFSVEVSGNSTAFYTISILSLGANIGVLIYQVRTIRKRRLNPLKEELYTDTAQYREIVDANRETVPV